MNKKVATTTITTTTTTTTTTTATTTTTTTTEVVHLIIAAVRFKIQIRINVKSPYQCRVAAYSKVLLVLSSSTKGQVYVRKTTTFVFAAGKSVRMAYGNEASIS